MKKKGISTVIIIALLIIISILLTLSFYKSVLSKNDSKQLEESFKKYNDLLKGKDIYVYYSDEDNKYYAFYLANSILPDSKLTFITDVSDMLAEDTFLFFSGTEDYITIDNFDNELFNVKLQSHIKKVNEDIYKLSSGDFIKSNFNFDKFSYFKLSFYLTNRHYITIKSFYI
jgi:hypothetical protein